MANIRPICHVRHLEIGKFPGQFRVAASWRSCHRACRGLTAHDWVQQRLARNLHALADAVADALPEALPQLESEVSGVLTSGLGTPANEAR